MRSIAKSLGLAFMGTGLLFFFMMMVVIPAQSMFARLNGNIAKTSVVVNPSVFLRVVGVPFAAVSFIALFAVMLYRFHRQELQKSAPAAVIAARH